MYVLIVGTFCNVVSFMWGSYILALKVSNNAIFSELIQSKNCFVWQIKKFLPDFLGNMDAIENNSFDTLIQQEKNY